MLNKSFWNDHVHSDIRSLGKGKSNEEDEGGQDSPSFQESRLSGQLHLADRGPGSVPKSLSHSSSGQELTKLLSHCYLQGEQLRNAKAWVLFLACLRNQGHPYLPLLQLRASDSADNGVRAKRETLLNYYWS